MLGLESMNRKTQMKMKQNDKQQQQKKRHRDHKFFIKFATKKGWKNQKKIK